MLECFNADKTANFLLHQLSSKERCFDIHFSGQYFGHNYHWRGNGFAQFIPIQEEQGLALHFRADFSCDINGKSIHSCQQYIFRSEHKSDRLSIYFVDIHSGVESTRRLFQDITLDISEPKMWKASGLHQCGDDQYSSRYFFGMENASLESISWEHKVVGPQKNYKQTILISTS